MIIPNIITSIIRRIRFGHPSFGWTTQARESMLWDAWRYCAEGGVEGGYAEFGVWRGDTFATSFHYMKDRMRSKKCEPFIAFDSFEGFPEPKGIDAGDIFIKGGRTCSLDDFKLNAAKHKIPLNEIHIYKGWFNKSLQTASTDGILKARSLAMAWIDCDLYESTRDCLPAAIEALKDGGVLIFDNWHCFGSHPQKGEQRAFHEAIDGIPTLVANPFKSFGWHGMSFIINRVDSSFNQKKVGY